MAASFKKSLTVLNHFRRRIQVRKIVNSGSMLTSSASQSDVLTKTSPKIEEIANNIAQLNLLEVAELTDVLKKKLNLPDAPMMAMAPGAVGAVAAEKEDEAPASAQTSFSVKLISFDEKQKVPLIKEIKNLMEGMNLVQAKKFVESAPIVVKGDIGKTEAEELSDALAKVGAVVEIV